MKSDKALMRSLTLRYFLLLALAAPGSLQAFLRVDMSKHRLTVFYDNQNILQLYPEDFSNSDLFISISNIAPYVDCFRVNITTNMACFFLAFDVFGDFSIRRILGDICF